MVAGVVIPAQAGIQFFFTSMSHTCGRAVKVKSYPGECEREGNRREKEEGRVGHNFDPGRNKPAPPVFIAKGRMERPSGERRNLRGAYHSDVVIIGRGLYAVKVRRAKAAAEAFAGTALCIPKSKEN